MDHPIYIIGAGGHAKVVISTLLACGVPVAAAYADDVSQHGSSVLGVRVAGGSDDFAALEAVRAVIAVGNNRVREKFACSFPNVEWVRAVHPRAFVHESVEPGPGSVIFAGAVVQPDAVIGAHCIVNTGATIDHDCRIGDYAHLAPGVHLAGNVVVGKGAFLGIGSCVIPRIRIGAGAVVGAGSVVIRDVPEGATVVGVPARVARGAS